MARAGCLPRMSQRISHRFPPSRPALRARRSRRNPMSGRTLHPHAREFKTALSPPRYSASTSCEAEATVHAAAYKLSTEAIGGFETEIPMRPPLPRAPRAVAGRMPVRGHPIMSPAWSGRVQAAGQAALNALMAASALVAARVITTGRHAARGR